jgi:hypothetical protein
MKNATAIMQPSLFEGWSTVIEDAKSLQVPVIASDLKSTANNSVPPGHILNRITQSNWPNL